MSEKSARKKKTNPSRVRKRSQKVKSDDALKDAVLKAALKDAAFDGFTEAVLVKACKAAGADKVQLTRLFPEGPSSLIAYFSTSLDAAMEKRLSAIELGKLKIRERIKTAILTRLELIEPHKEAARRAAAALTLPMNAGLGAKLIYNTVDTMWRAAGDTSTDFNFYTKRGILACVYGSVLMRWFSDTGEDGAATERFLDARIENVMQFEKFKAKARETLSGFPGFAAWVKPKAN